jgi:hypothetical protein
LVQVNLQSLLAQDGMLDGLGGRDVSLLDASVVNVDANQNDRQLSSGLAQCIAQVMRSGG